jgi:preprotein translocase subunit SecG
MTFLFFTAIFFFIILCVVLCAAILLQEGKGGGLGASFGGDAGESVFGTATAEVLKKFTGWMAFAFFTACVMLSLWTSAMGRTQESTPAMEIEETQGT